LTAGGVGFGTTDILLLSVTQKQQLRSKDIIQALTEDTPKALKVIMEVIPRASKVMKENAKDTKRLRMDLEISKKVGTK
jgi:hypothetical protein